MWPEIASACGTCAAALTTWFAWHQSHKDRKDDRIQRQIEHGIQPVTEQLKLAEQKFDLTLAHIPATIEAAVTRANAPLQERITVLESKVDDLKDAVKNINSAV